MITLRITDTQALALVLTLEDVIQVENGNRELESLLEQLNARVVRQRALTTSQARRHHQKPEPHIH